MKTGFTGTFVISWSQTEVDGQWAAPRQSLRVGASWTWTGDPVRVDGPNGVLRLGVAEGESDLRERAAEMVRNLVKAVEVDRGASASPLAPPPPDSSFNVTDGHSTWTVMLVETGPGRAPLCVFSGGTPPRHADLWVISHNVDRDKRDNTKDKPGGVICFTPGTKILTDQGPRAVETLTEGSRIQTKDNGCETIQWMGKRRISGARLFAMPHLAPVRLLEGALDKDVPDAGLLVSPDHRVIWKGAKARALFNADEVLVTARDIVNDQTIIVDRTVREVTYIHLLLEEHQVVFANGVETESFHPASASLDSLGDEERTRLFHLLPSLRRDPRSYGDYARRVLSENEAALLSHEDRRWAAI